MLYIFHDIIYRIIYMRKEFRIKFLLKDALWKWEWFASFFFIDSTSWLFAWKTVPQLHLLLEKNSSQRSNFTTWLARTWSLLPSPQEIICALPSITSFLFRNTKSNLENNNILLVEECFVLIVPEFRILA